MERLPNMVCAAVGPPTGGFSPLVLPTAVLLAGVYISAVVLESVLRPLTDVARYVLYVVPIFGFLLWLHASPRAVFQRPAVRGYFAPLIAMHTVVVVSSLSVFLLEQRVPQRFVYELTFVFLPLFFGTMFAAVLTGGCAERIMKLCLVGYVLAYLIAEGTELLVVVTNPQMLLQALWTSSIPTESVYCFAFGMFFLFFASIGNRSVAAVSLAFALVSFKRIALAGMAIGFLSLFLPRAILRRSNLVSLFLLLANMAFVWLVIEFTKGSFGDLNALTMGRQQLFRLVVDHVQLRPWGVGLGGVNSILYETNYPLRNFHSDVFKHYLEFGPILFCLWVVVFARVNARLPQMIPLLLYLNTLFFTDNVFVYVEIMTLFYMMQASYQSMECRVNMVQPFTGCSGDVRGVSLTRA